MELSQALEAQLGKSYPAKDVAVALRKSQEWVYKNAADLGGVKLGGRWQFFEKNIVEALRPTSLGGSFANKTEEPKDGKNGMVRQDSFAGREAQGEEATNQSEGIGVGAVDQAEVERVLINEDPCGLLAHSHDKASAGTQGKGRGSRNVR